jgi:hypothetical protein
VTDDPLPDVIIGLPCAGFGGLTGLPIPGLPIPGLAGDFDISMVFNEPSFIMGNPTGTTLPTPIPAPVCGGVNVFHALADELVQALFQIFL